MNTQTNERCPLCKNQCLLSEPQCRKGKEYAQNMENQELKESQEPSQLEIRLMTLFQKCSHLLSHRKGHQQSQGRILSILMEKGSMTQRELLDFADIRSSSMSELIGKLEAERFIERSISKEDRRNLNISLTESGMIAAGNTKQNRYETASELFSVLTDEEKQELEIILTHLFNQWIQGNEDKLVEERQSGHFRGHVKG